MKNLVYLFSAILMLLTCTRQLTEPKEFSLAGTVTLSGLSDYSGITVELYAAEPDTAITNRLAQFPSVGLDLSRDLLFDHRLADPDYSTTTDENGSFSFSKIPDGQYNLIAEKAEYGWQYVLNVDASSDIPDLRLFPEVRHSGVIQTYEVWPADRHIIVSGNLVIQEGATLLIDKGCVVRMDGDLQVRVDGDLRVNGTPEDLVWLTANTPSKEPGYIAWRGIAVNNGLEFNYGRIDFAETGIRTSSSDYTINHSIFSKCGTYNVLLTKESTGVFENNILLNSQTGLKIEGNSYADVQRNLFVQSGDQALYGTGVLVNTSSAVISDNIFLGLETGCTFEFNCSGEFLHNYVDKCRTGIFVNKAAFSGDAPVAILSNIFGESGKTAVDVYISVSPTIEQNNFSAAGSGLFVTAFAVYYSGAKAVSYPNNFWTIPDERVILRRIDIRDNDSDREPFEVNIAPVASQFISNGGPRLN
jgi:hypothetical protein